MKKLFSRLFCLVVIAAMLMMASACSATVTTVDNSSANANNNYTTTTTTTTTKVSKYYLSGAELERVETMLEGSWSGKVSGNRVEYDFKDGSFKAYAEIGGQVIQNNGTYRITNVDIELSFQNGTSKVFTYQINGGELALQLQ